MSSRVPVLQRIDPPRRRLICIGDIHGCYEELQELLGRVKPRSGDVVVATGDIVRKGPDAVSCLELFRENEFLTVRGNNEEKLLEFVGKPRARRLLLPSVDRKVLRRADLVEFMDSWPVAVEIRALKIVIVHGGLFPAMPVHEDTIASNADDLIRLRWIRRQNGGWVRAGKTKDSDKDVLWSDVWDGPRTVVYGHTPGREPRIDDYSIGLDTGCVYGGSLTAAIYDGKWKFEQVRAHKKYAD